MGGGVRRRHSLRDTLDTSAVPQILAGRAAALGPGLKGSGRGPDTTRTHLLPLCSPGDLHCQAEVGGGMGSRQAPSVPLPW